METLSQLLERSQREIEAHASDDETSPYFVQSGAQLLASLSLLAQSRSEGDETVRSTLASAVPSVLTEAAEALEAQGTGDGRVAAGFIRGIAGKPERERSTIVTYALKGISG